MGMGKWKSLLIVGYRIQIQRGWLSEILGHAKRLSSSPQLVPDVEMAGEDVGGRGLSAGFGTALFPWSLHGPTDRS